MGTVMLTAVLCTARKEPGFQWMADSLTTALNVYKGSFELIVVDKLLWDTANDCEICQCPRARRQELSNAINGRFSYRHVPPKPSPWQGPWRKTKQDWYDLNGARNTGICLARGNHIILFDDCSTLDENFLVGHAQGAKHGAAVAGSFRSYNKAKIENGRIIDGELHPMGIDGRGDRPMLAPGGWLFGLNCSFPLQAAIDTNGYDELYSGQGGSEDCDHGVRISRKGYKIIYIPSCLIYQILENHDPVCEIETWGRPQKTPQKELVLKDGKSHFANERLIEELIDDQTRCTTRGNDFNLKDLREKALRKGQFPMERTLEIDWRDGQKLRDM